MKNLERTFESFLPLLVTEEFIKENPDLIEKEKSKWIAIAPQFEDAKRHYDAMVKINTRKRLKHINTPTLILQGKKDRTNSYKNSLELVKLIPYSNLALFEKTGHLLFAEEFERVIPILLEFLEE